MTERSQFNSRIGLLLAAAGSAVGLGNIWRFPTEVGQNGGAAFILLYIACIIIFGMPIMIGEFMIGRESRVSVGRSYKKLKPNTPWKWLGRGLVITPFLILCYYNVVAGWTLYYLGSAVSGTLSAVSNESLPQYFNEFTGGSITTFSGGSAWQLVCLLVFSLLTHFIVTKGVSKGIERFAKVMMPGLFLILVALCICSLTMDGAPVALNFLFKPDWSKITPKVTLSAIGQAFYSLSLAMGILTTYASYFREDTNLGKTALQIGVLDTLVSVMAGIVIFPAVFSVAGADAVSAGPSLIFIALPGVFNTVFAQLPILGYVFSLAFYALLVLATLTTTISLHEAVASYISEAWEWNRTRSARAVTAVCLLIGLSCALSFGPWKEFTVCGMTLFDLFDFVTAKLMLPLGGLLISIFAGWHLPVRVWWLQMTNRGTRQYPFFGVTIFMLRWVCPFGIMLIFLHQLGFFNVHGIQ